MPVVESKIKFGTLTFGSETPGPVFTASCQPTAVALVPTATDVGEAVEVLCGDEIPPDTNTTWAMTLTAIQDWGSETGFIPWTLTNDLVTMPYTWAPNGPTGVTYTGNVQVRALQIGGDVGVRITSDATWPLTEAPTPTYPTP